MAGEIEGQRQHCFPQQGQSLIKGSVKLMQWPLMPQ